MKDYSRIAEGFLLLTVVAVLLFTFSIEREMIEVKTLRFRSTERSFADKMLDEDLLHQTKSLLHESFVAQEATRMVSYEELRDQLLQADRITLQRSSALIVWAKVSSEVDSPKNFHDLVEMHHDKDVVYLIINRKDDFICVTHPIKGVLMLQGD